MHWWRIQAVCVCGVSALWAGLFLGCGPANRATVSGAVTMGGELVDRGSVTFHPLDGGAIAHGQVAPDGSYALHVGAAGFDRVVPGEYVVTIVIPQATALSDTPGPPDPVMRLSDAKYANKELSPLRCKVEPGANIHSFDVDVAEDFSEQLAGIAASGDHSPGETSEDGDAARTPASDAASESTLDAGSSQEDGSQETESGDQEGDA